VPHAFRTRSRGTLAGLIATEALLCAAPAARAQATAGSTAPRSAVDSTNAASPPEPADITLPIFATLGIGYGLRSDPCAHCPSPDDTDSFTGQLSVGKRLGHGFGVGVGVSVWRRTHPGPPGAADSTGVPTPTKLSNMLGNASLIFSYQIWHVFVRAGGGLAWGRQDLVDPDPDASAPILTASGVGIGYTAGGGFTLPLAPPISLAFFANYNAGSYDLTTPVRVIERGATHRYLEMGVGVTLR